MSASGSDNTLRSDGLSRSDRPSRSDKTLAYALLRITVGINFAGHGLARIHSGVATFAQTTAGHMAHSPLPGGLVLGFAYSIPWIEAMLGALLLLGLRTRAALVATAVFMMALTAGVTANQQWDIAGQQLLYSLVLFALLFLLQWNGWSVDAWLEAHRESAAA